MILLLGFSINFEPTRIGLVPLMLSRPQPNLQLLALWGSSFIITSGFGVAVLLLFRHHRVSAINLNPGVLQILLGLLAFALSALLISREFYERYQ